MSKLVEKQSTGGDVPNQKFKIHGYTSWINMRLNPFGITMGNVLMDILKETNMKFLLQSFTGSRDDKFTTFER